MALLELKTRPERHFLMVFTMFFLHAPKILHKKSNIKNYQKITKKTNFLLVFSFLGLPPLAPNGSFPRASFDGICDVLCTSSTLHTLQKRAVFLPPGGGRRRFARPLIAKAKATPHAMRSNMPGIRCLVHHRI